MKMTKLMKLCCFALLGMSLFFTGCEDADDTETASGGSGSFVSGWYKYSPVANADTGNTYIEYDGSKTIIRAGSDRVEYKDATLTQMRATLTFDTLSEQAKNSSLVTFAKIATADLPSWYTGDRTDSIGTEVPFSVPELTERTFRYTIIDAPINGTGNFSSVEKLKEETDKYEIVYTVNTGRLIQPPQIHIDSKKPVGSCCQSYFFVVDTKDTELNITYYLRNKNDHSKKTNTGTLIVRKE